MQGNYSIGVGQGNGIYGRNSIGLGHNVQIGKYENGINYIDSSVAMGSNSSIQAGSSRTSGLGTQGGYSIAVGVDTSIEGGRNEAMGYGSAVIGNDSTALGYRSKVYYANESMAIGNGAQISDASAAPLENGKATITKGAVAMGVQSSIGKEASYSTALGYGSSVGNNASYSTVLGYASSIGNTTSGASALGYHATVSEGANFAIAIGYASVGSGAVQSTAIGASSSISEGTQYAVALGSNSSVGAGASYSAAVGALSRVTTGDLLTKNNWKAKGNWDAQADSGYGVFSVGSSSGSSNFQRRVINVANGRITSDSTDAVNGSQLYAAFDFLDKKIDGITIEGDKNIDVDKKPDTSGGTGGTGGTGDIEPGQTPKPSPGWDVSMSDTPTFGGGETGTDKTKPGSVTVVGGQGNITINEGDKGTVSGLSNLKWDSAKADVDVKDGGYKNSSNAATESQLQQAVEGTVQYDRDKDGNINKGSITLAGGNGGTTITNVADGTISSDSKDAVNGSQLYGIQQQVTNNTTAITNIGNGLHKLDRRINKVGAGAAALAALHPLDFDPDDKWDFAAGYGHYASANAAAVGAYYRPNEDTMFSVGGAFGNGENMVNAGVSFKLGQGNHVSTSRVAMAKEIISLRKELEELKSAMLDAHTGKTLDPSKLQLFPDVPKNHWAYEYVSELAGNGMLEGYPDGTFGGDRSMTRYEFATMLYRSMMKGAVLSDRLLTEFQPELELIRVDVISKDKEGRPTIERVRINQPV